LPFNFKFDGANFLPNSVPGSPEDSFIAGDPRCNELPTLTSLQTLFIREHNRLANEIVIAGNRLNLHLPDQFIWELARYCNIIQYQKIVYNEWLPSILGRFAPNLSTMKYSDQVDPTTSIEYIATGMRFAHSIVSEDISFLDSNLRPILKMPLSNAFFQPSLITKFGIEPVLRGVCHQKHQAVDTEIVPSLREQLFIGTMNLIDLISIDIQRGRDVGAPSYTKLRFDLLGETVNDWSAITPNAQLQQKLSSIYHNVNNVDPIIGLLAEAPIGGDCIVGRTLAAFISNAFQNYARGDRCFHTNIIDPYRGIFEKGANILLSDIILLNTILTRNEIQPFVFNVPH